MNRAFRISVAGAGLISLSACGPTIRTDRDESIVIPQGASWAWGPREPAPRSERELGPGGEIVRQRFQRAIAAALQARGYRQVDDTSQADFLLTFDLGVRGIGRAPVAPTAAVGVGFYGGWGYHPWGWYRPRGFYRPWGFYQPWGWGWYGAPVWGGVVTPMYPLGYRSYGEGALVVVLRQRTMRYVAWRGRVSTDLYDSRRLSQERVQRIVNKLFEGLR